MRAGLASFAIAMLVGIGAAWAGPVGQYAVVGANPGGNGQYTGSVTVEQTGDTFKITWAIGGTLYVGTGIGDKNFLAVSYRSGDKTGLALYGADGDGWTGIWTYAGGVKVGPETWKRN